MKRFISALFFSALIALGVKAIGWPSGFEGVMLQGFYWDSYQTDTKWTKLEAQADELSKSFKLIWVPNSSKSSGGLGYMPIYWFTNHNSDMGSEAQLRSMIKTFKAKGTGIIADLVLNHRAGRTNWIDFPKETWNGESWYIGPDGICRNDEVNNPGNPGGATGAYDEGENFDGARDLDHTNATVQNNCKNYAKCLLQDFGYAGFRLDMVKGYAGYYTKMYNQYAKPTYSVGEYWDGSYDALAAWIESTGGESAAFDFAFKYAVNEAFSSGDLTKLVWRENGVTPKPAGLIHHWYQQLAVTFIDNHDTYRDDWNKFNGNVLAANAFMLFSPGTPCVFLPHWKEYKNELATLIAIRNAAGISNTSDVRVLRTSNTCYMAEITGSKGKVVIKIGPDYVSPDGYTNDDIKTSGNDYCVWTKVSMPLPPAVPDQLYIIGDLADSHWATNKGVEMTKSGNSFTATSVEFTPQSGLDVAYFSFATAIGTKGTSTEWDAIINKSDRFGATAKDAAIVTDEPLPFKTFYGGKDASSANSWSVIPGSYDVFVNFDTETVTITKDHGVSAITGPEAVTVSDAREYYTLQGVRVTTPSAAGVYIVKEGPSVTKRFIPASR